MRATFSWAVSLAVASLAPVSLAAAQLRLVAHGQDPQGQSTQNQLTLRDQDLWKGIESSVVTLISGGQPVGAAALIDESGLFVASLDALPARDLDGRLSDGRTVHLHVRSKDRCTQLALLQADGLDTSGMTPFHAPERGTAPCTVFALLPGGPVRVELVSYSRVGIVGKARRFMPLSEVRFEGSPDQFNGAIFVRGHEIQGIMTSVLDKPVAMNSQEVFNLQNNVNHFAPNLRPGYGPAPQTVGYVTGPEIVDQVLEGFLSPAHIVEHPYLGVVCRDAIGGGAEVVQVSSDSPAEEAGIRVGDVLLGLSNVTIRNQMDFAAAMFHQKIGQKIVLLIRRDRSDVVQEAIVGKQED